MHSARSESKVIVDTPIWSLALRRRRRELPAHERALVHAWTRLLDEGLAALLGPIRQEILSGVRDDRAFEKLRLNLRGVPDEPLTTDDFEFAAACGNRCRAAGVAAGVVDLLICAVSLLRGYHIFTLDRDFERYSRVLGIRLLKT